MFDQPEDPSPADLAKLQAEEPLIDAEMDLVSAEAAVFGADNPSELDLHRLSVAMRRVEATRAHFAVTAGRYGWEAA